MHIISKYSLNTERIDFSKIIFVYLEIQVSVHIIREKGGLLIRRRLRLSKFFEGFSIARKDTAFSSTQFELNFSVADSGLFIFLD